MKTGKQITLDVEIMEKLRQEENASALIERLLREHYSFSSDKKKNLMIQKEIMLKNYSKAAKLIKKEINLMRKVELLGMDTFSIRWLRSQDIMPNTLSIRAYRNGRDLNINTENFIKAWEVITDNVDIFAKV